MVQDRYIEKVMTAHLNSLPRLLSSVHFSRAHFSILHHLPLSRRALPMPHTPGARLRQACSPPDYRQGYAQDFSASTQFLGHWQAFTPSEILHHRAYLCAHAAHLFLVGVHPSVSYAGKERSTGGWVSKLGGMGGQRITQPRGKTQGMRPSTTRCSGCCR